MSETTPEAGRYAAVPPQVDLPAMEHEIIDLWHRQHTFEKTLEATKDGEPWTFFEGPPTANGQPGTHHVEARVFKDVFPRYRTMRGYHVDRKAGWDCHGLPVELAVEKELGFSGRRGDREVGHGNPGRGETQFRIGGEVADHGDGCFSCHVRLRIRKAWIDGSLT